MRMVRAGEIGRYAASRSQHAAIHQLRLGHALGGAAQPVCRLLLVALDAEALLETDPEVEGGDEVARGGGLREPSRHPRRS